MKRIRECEGKGKTKRNQSERVANMYYKTPIWFSKKQQKLEKYKDKLIKKRTHEESNVKYALDLLGINYKEQKGFIKGNFCIVDFYIPKPYGICLEVDGAYHTSIEQQKRDKNRTHYLEVIRGLKVRRIPNCVTKFLTTKQLSEIILELINS